jgi:hypothetical protein
MAQQYTKTKGKKSDAYIIDLDGEWRVKPSVSVVKNPDEFDICNLTSTTFIIDVSGPGGGPGFTLGPGDWKSVPLSKERGVYTYTVTLASDPTRKARGDSDPVIIIDPPGN